ncbi:MAG TPA: hypothetical protein RMH99_00705, partial [Sandaracinaceae bacterium LLY-WYZ-13_1]|nr:hypothetical protein [Sandaracinaceae bacterium LLY-WYZ-13_1]
MSGRALSPSPVALFLLGLAERGADGSVEVGGRTILLRKGQVVDVRPAEGDGDLAAFLRDSGRVASGPLDRCVAMAREEGAPLADVLLRQRLLGEETLRGVRRALWLDRLVRGMARASAEGREPAPLQADVRVPASGPGANLVGLVLDALERRAADEDAGYVGARASHRVQWLGGPHLERARRWARFQTKDERPAVSTLLQTEPAAAPRIAALVRAGLARIVSPDAPPAPAPRVSQIPVTGALGRHTPPLGSPAGPAPAGRSSLPPRRRPSVQLDPGLSPLFEDEPVLDVDLPAFPERAAPLDDPLDELERTIAGLEQRDAPGAERAAAWTRFGEVWESRFGSVEEAARAYREAAAADDTDPAALARASEACAAIGQADLAVAYARAAVSAAPEGPEHARALWRYARLCRRLGKLSEALGATRAAASAAPDDPSPLALAAILWRELGRPEDAAAAAVDAAARVRDSDPSRALSLVAVAQGLDPGSPELAEAYATALAEAGLVEAAIAVRADGVRRTRDPDARRALLLAAAEQAELADRPALAAALLTRAFDAEPHLEVLYEPLDADLAESGATLERAVLLEEMAAAASDDARAQWLERAAAARLDLPGDGAWEAELRARALELEPENDANLQYVRDEAAAHDDPRLLADTLERALTRGRWSGAKPQARMLEELARLAEERLAAP